MAVEVTTMADASTVSVPLGDVDDIEFRGGSVQLSRDRPFSSSQRSTASSKSAVTQNPTMVTSMYTANNLFSFKVSRQHSCQPLISISGISTDSVLYIS